MTDERALRRPVATRGALSAATIGRVDTNGRLPNEVRGLKSNCDNAEKGEAAKARDSMLYKAKTKHTKCEPGASVPTTPVLVRQR